MQINQAAILRFHIADHIQMIQISDNAVLIMSLRIIDSFCIKSMPSRIFSQINIYINVIL